MEEFGIDSISRTEALDFQADYEYELDQITMIPEIHQLLLALHKNHIPIGILTNGPVDLQSRKLQNIDAYQYFEKQNIIISQATHGGAAENSYEGNVNNLQSYRNVQLSKRAIEILKDSILIIKIMDGFLLPKVVINPTIMEHLFIIVSLTISSTHLKMEN